MARKICDYNMLSIHRLSLLDSSRENTAPCFVAPSNKPSFIVASCIRMVDLRTK